MTNTQPASFTGGIPTAYDRHLGPVLFEPFARDLARRVPIHEGVRLLETACGTGIATRRVLDHLPTSGRMVVTDLSQGMVDYARTAVSHDPRIEWRAADAQVLPFEKELFDAVVMQFGLMFLRDKALGLREAKRVLKPGGRLLLNTWQSLEKNPFGRITEQVLRSAFPVDPPTINRAQFADHDPQQLQQRAEAAGFRDVVVEDIGFESMAESAEHFAKGLIRGSAVSLAIGARSGASHEEVEQLLVAALRRELGDRPVRVELNAWLVSATA